MYKLSASSTQNLDGVREILVRVVEVALTLTPIDFGIPEYGGLRTAVEQNSLFIRELSNCDGYEKLSSHQSGDAFDFFAYANGRAGWDPVHMAQIWGAIHAASKIVSKERGVILELEWGGNWKNFKDYPHVQIKSIGECH